MIAEDDQLARLAMLEANYEFLEAARKLIADAPAADRIAVAQQAARDLVPLVRQGRLTEADLVDDLGYELHDAGVPQREAYAAILRAVMERTRPEAFGKLIARPFVLGDPRAIAPRAWLYGRHYIRKFVSATVAPGGLGKSSLALVEAVDMATGRGLLSGKPGPLRRVWYWCGEDPREEIERRVAAICLHYGITADDLGDRLFIDSGRDTPLIMATESRDGVQLARPVADGLATEMQASRIDVLVLDPFVATHAVSENDNGAINAVARQFAEIADQANAAVELVHHLRKGAPGASGDRSVDDARGARALIDATRSTRVLNPMTEDEAGALGIAPEHRRRYFRVDDGKANLVPPSTSAVWRYLASVSLDNGTADMPADFVGVVTAWDKPAVGDGITQQNVADLHQRLEAGAPNRRNARSPDWVGCTLAPIIEVDPAEKPARKRVGALVDHLIAMGVLVVRRTPNGKGREIECVLPGLRVLPQSPQSDCGVTVATVGAPPPADPHTSGLWGVGSECGGFPQSADCGDREATERMLAG
jgi:hypothetical protein